MTLDSIDQAIIDACAPFLTSDPLAAGALVGKLLAAHRYGISAQDAAFEWADEYTTRTMEATLADLDDDAERFQSWERNDDQYRAINQAIRKAVGR